MNTETINIIIKAVITIITALLTSVIIPFVKAKIGEEKYTRLLSYTEYAVRCAEQIYKPEQWKEKKQYVYNYILQKVDDMGIELNASDIDLLVEGIVNLVKYDGAKEQ